jgi:hypothetical protein
MSLPDTLEANTNYSGLTNILTSSFAGDYSDVLADIEGEQETIPDLAPQDFEDENLQPVPAVSSGLPPQWEEAISSVGKGVTETTDREYIRLVFFAPFFLLY